MKKSKLIIFMMSLALISKLMGFLRVWLIGNIYGSTNLTDVFFVIDLIPTVIFALVYEGVSSTIIPIYLESKQKNEHKKFILDLVISLTLISVVLITLGLFFSKSMIFLFAPGFTEYQKDLGAMYLKPLLLTSFFIVISSVIKGKLNAENKFLASSFEGIIYNMFFIILIVCTLEYKGLDKLVFSNVIALVIRCIYLFPLSGIEIKEIDFKFYKNKYVKEMIFLSLPLIITLGMSEINSLIDKNLASRLSAGTITAMNYSRRINSLFTGLVIQVLITYFSPKISKLIIQKDIKKMEKIKIVLIYSIFITSIIYIIGVFIFGKTMIKFVFNLSKLDNKMILLISSCLLAYSLSNVTYGINQIYIKLLFSLKKVKYISISGFISIATNIFFNLLFFKKYGAVGLATATSISSFVNCVILKKYVDKSMRRYKNEL